MIVNTRELKIKKSQELADKFQLRHCNQTEYLVKNIETGDQVWADGAVFHGDKITLLEAKFTSNPVKSAFNLNGKAKRFLINKILPKMKSEFQRYSSVIAGNKNITGLTVLVNHQDIAQYFVDLMDEFKIPGQVLVVK